MAGRRSYDDPCGVARGMDVIGERLALLVVRELLFGPKRFTDLHRALHGASQNVLARRLRELERAGVVRRRMLGPPVSGRVYELTDWGRDLEPVLVHLGRWGGRAPMTSDGGLGVDAMMLALKTTFEPKLAGDLRATYELGLSDDRFRVGIADGRIEIARGPADAPDAVVETDAMTLRSLTFGGSGLRAAVSAGAVRVTGDQKAVRRLLSLFPRPTAAPPTSPG